MANRYTIKMEYENLYCKTNLDCQINDWWLRSTDIYSDVKYKFTACVYGGGGVHDRISGYDGGVAPSFII